MKTIIKTAIVALTLAAGATAGQAGTVWHYPYKGTPYATQSQSTRTVTANEAKARKTLGYVKAAKRPHAKGAIKGTY